VFGLHPSTSLVPDIVTPGPERVRALMTIGANPVLSSAGGGERLEHALQQLDLHFSLDLYVTETNKYADTLLPVPSFYEALRCRSRHRRDARQIQCDGHRRAARDVREEWKILRNPHGAWVWRRHASRWMRGSRIGVEITPAARRHPDPPGPAGTARTATARAEPQVVTIPTA
jgi:formate dehydrogenase